MSLLSILMLAWRVTSVDFNLNTSPGDLNIECGDDRDELRFLQLFIWSLTLNREVFRFKFTLVK